MSGKDQRSGRLYVVATPIGNMDDITNRAIKVLSDADFILSEDTRTTKKLLSHYRISNKLESCYSYNEQERARESIDKILKGENAALVSESGTPGISDPGSHLIRLAREKGIRIIPVPGPSAMTASISVSGAQSNKIYFAGFLPRTKGKRIKELLSMKALNMTTVIYESPKRIRRTLTDIGRFIPGRKLFVIREMTKVHEESFFGDPAQILKDLTDANALGEFSIVMFKGDKNRGAGEKKVFATARKIARNMRLSTKDASKLLSFECGIPKKQAYRIFSNMKSSGDDEE